MNGQGGPPFCRNIQQLGHCRFGARCRFAHCAAENTNGDSNPPAVTEREWVWAEVRYLSPLHVEACSGPSLKLLHVLPVRPAKCNMAYGMALYPEPLYSEWSRQQK